MPNIWLAEPRGFCAGVRRAVRLVEETLQKFGAPVYVRHEIVHNKHVIAELQSKGAVFIEDIHQADPLRPLIFSAHGVSAAVAAEAEAMGLQVIDATCPLVAKVHAQVRKYATAGMEIIVIGKAEHPEIIGTVGQAPQGTRIQVINSPKEAEELIVDPQRSVGFVTQTTLSEADTQDIVAILKHRFPHLNSLKKDDICFATTNRQAAVKALAQKAPAVIIIGSKNSSNSRQLRETALKNGAQTALLIDNASELDWHLLAEFENIGISAGASAPEYLVEELLLALRAHYDKINIHHVIINRENVEFKH